MHLFKKYSHLGVALRIRTITIKSFQRDAAVSSELISDPKDVDSTTMGVVIGLTSRSNSSRRCVRDLSHQANHGSFGQLII